MDIVFASDRKDVVPCIKLCFGSADERALRSTLSIIIERTRPTRVRPKISVGRDVMGPLMAKELYANAEREYKALTSAWTPSCDVVIFFPPEFRWLLDLVLEALELELRAARADISRAWSPPDSPTAAN
ncbi:MAG TPA: hypothetical protein VLB83_05800 [Candidatus Paceibacterota bacterium]|nr:hypothetical protein [Candidatus Paceibacterota bacterium]